MEYHIYMCIYTPRIFGCLLSASRGGAVAPWLVRSSPDRAVRVRALAGDIVLCSWARHLTLTAPLSTQVYKWVPDWHPIQGGVKILIVASC